MTTCVVCNHSAVLDDQKLGLDDDDVNHNGLTLRARLAKIMEEEVLREDGWMCTPCQLQLSQIEIYYSMLLVFKQKYWSTTQLWEQEHGIGRETKEPNFKIMVPENLDFSLLDKQRQNDWRPDVESKNVLEERDIKLENPQSVDVHNNTATRTFRPETIHSRSNQSCESRQSVEEDSKDPSAEAVGYATIEMTQEEKTDDSSTDTGDEFADLSNDEECREKVNNRQIQNPKAMQKCKLSNEEDDWKPTKKYPHKKSYVYKQEPAPCPICNKVLKNKLVLKKHLKTHENPKPTCAICNKTFRKESVYLMHMKTHSRTNGKTFSCYICGIEFDMVRDYKAHLKAHREESSETNPNDFPICLQTSEQSIKLKKHMKIHKGEKPYICNICEKAFVRPVTLKRHMLSHSDDKPYICKICGHSFKSDIYLKLHVKAHTEGHECTVCNKKFTTRDSLKVHSLTHTDEKRFRCEVCGRPFRQLAHVKAHMQTHSTEKAPAKFICSTCGKTFAVRTQLNYHMMSHTGEWQSVCSICGKGCVNEYVLKRHMVCHTGVKPNKCSICGKGFTHGGNLTQHMLTHTGEKPHQCSVCGAAYTCKYKMKRHELMKHGVVTNG